MSADNPDPSRYGADKDGDYDMADFDEQHNNAVADVEREAARKRELDRQLLQAGIDKSGPPVPPRPQDAGAQRNQLALAGRGNAAGKQPALAQAPAPAPAPSGDNDSVPDSKSNEEERAVAQSSGPKGIVILPTKGGDSSASDSESDDDYVDPIAAAIARASNGSGNPGPSSSGGGDGASVLYQGADRTVMLVCGPTKDPSLNDAQEDKVDEVVAALKKEDLSGFDQTKAAEETKRWVHHCFSRQLPHYKCAARKLSSHEEDERAAQLQALRSGLDDPSNRGRAPTSYTLRNESSDIDGLVQKTNHMWLRNPDDVNRAKEALKREYDAFMLEERCRILKVVKRAREKRITCEEAELDTEKDVEREYMDALLLEEAPLISECNEARQFDQEELKEHKGPLDYDVDELKDFTELLGEYIRNDLAKNKNKKRPEAGADDTESKGKKFPPPGTPVPKMDMHQNTQCDICEEWIMERKAWLAETKEEMDDILKDPEYQAAMKRLFELRSELNGPKSAWPGWPQALTTHFNNNEPLAKMVDTACPKQEDDQGGKKAQAAAKLPGAKPEQRRLLDEVIIRHSGGADGCGTKTVRDATHTDTLLTEMLRCFPTNMQGEVRLNPLLDFLCWYRQHITLAASPTPTDNDGVTSRSLFYQALCAPTVLYKKGGKNSELPATGFDIAAYPEVVKHKAIYQSIDTLYTKINNAAETAFAALVADLLVDQSKSVLYRHNQELYAQWKAMYYPQRSYSKPM